jgi:hypothetical protein
MHLELGFLYMSTCIVISQFRNVARTIGHFHLLPLTILLLCLKEQFYGAETRPSLFRARGTGVGPCSSSTAVWMGACRVTFMNECLYFITWGKWQKCNCTPIIPAPGTQKTADWDCWPPKFAALSSRKIIGLSTLKTSLVMSYILLNEVRMKVTCVTTQQTPRVSMCLALFSFVTKLDQQWQRRLLYPWVSEWTQRDSHCWPTWTSATNKIRTFTAAASEIWGSA